MHSTIRYNNNTSELQVIESLESLFELFKVEKFVRSNY